MDRDGDRGESSHCRRWIWSTPTLGGVQMVDLEALRLGDRDFTVLGGDADSGVQKTTMVDSSQSAEGPKEGLVVEQQLEVSSPSWRVSSWVFFSGKLECWRWESHVRSPVVPQTGDLSHFVQIGAGCKDDDELIVGVCRPVGLANDVVAAVNSRKDQVGELEICSEDCVLGLF